MFNKNSKTNKVIFIILDGLNYQVAKDCMGYLQALVATKQASRYKTSSELPSLSRPLYECLLTGTPPIVSGIVNNNISRLSDQQSIFSLASESGLTTAAAAYHWISELYNQTPYQKQHRFTNDVGLNIQHGLFYHCDDYPSDHLFIDAEYLRSRYAPNFLLIHPMSIDNAGHLFGLSSSQYRNSARHMDVILSEFIPTWIADGYQIMITSDHGMNDDKSHGGSLSEECEVPLYVIGSGFSHIIDEYLQIKQREICGTLCQLLEIEHDKPFCSKLLLNIN